MSGNVLIPKFVLKWYGYWEYEEKDHWIFRVHRTLGIGVFVLAFSALEWMHLISRVMAQADITQTTDDLAHALNHLLGVFKFFLIQRQKKFIKRVYELSVKDDRITYDDNEEFDRVKHEAWHGYSMMIFKALCLGCIIAAVFIVLGYATPFLAESSTYYAGANNTKLMTTRPLPFNTWVPFPEGLLPHYYWVFCYQAFSMFDVVFMMASFDLMFYGILGQMAAQFQILRYAISTIKERAHQQIALRNLQPSDYSTSPMYKQLYEVEMENELKKCAVHHQIIIRYPQLMSPLCFAFGHNKVLTVDLSSSLLSTHGHNQDINERFNTAILFQFSATLIVFCVSMFQCLVRSGLRVDFFYMIFYGMTITYELFIFCWIGQNVIEESSKLSAALYSSYWFEATSKYRSNFRLLLMRSQIPVQFSAFGVFPLNFETFGSIIKTGYSFFSVLKQVEFEETM